MSIRCAHTFNKTKNRIIFEQMVKIGTTGAISKISLEKGKNLVKCLQKVKEG